MNFNDSATRERRRREKGGSNPFMTLNGIVISPDALPRFVSIASRTATFSLRFYLEFSKIGRAREDSTRRVGKQVSSRHYHDIAAFDELLLERKFLIPQQPQRYEHACDISMHERGFDIGTQYRNRGHVTGSNHSWSENCCFDGFSMCLATSSISLLLSLILYKNPREWIGKKNNRQTFYESLLFVILQKNYNKNKQLYSRN